MMRRRCAGTTVVLAVVAGSVPALIGSAVTPLRVAAAVGDIATYAGVGAYGNGALATGADLALPESVIVERGGAIDIADTTHYVVRRIDPATGVITTIAGNGVPSSDPLLDDGKAANTVGLTVAWGLAADGRGNLYVSESLNNRVRRIDSSGIITTVAGSRDPLGDGSQCDSLYGVADRVSNTAGLIGDGGPATLACLHAPMGLATDNAGNLYIADSGHGRIRKVDTSGIISTVAGGGTCWVQGQEYSYCGDGGPATAASLGSSVDGVAVDGHGNVYLSDTAPNCSIRVVDTSGIISTLAGVGGCGNTGDGGDARLASLASPENLLVSGGSLYVADAGNNRIRAIDLATHRITAVAGYGAKGWSPDGWPVSQARFSGPAGMAIDPAGNLLVMDTGNSRLIRVDTGTHRIRTIAGSGSVCASDDGIPANHTVLCIPAGVASDPMGGVIIAEYGGNRVRHVAADGTITTLAGTGDNNWSGTNGVSSITGYCPPAHDGGDAIKGNLCEPVAVATNSAGDVYIAEQGRNTVRRVDRNTGRIDTVAGTGASGYSGDDGPAVAAQLSSPSGLAVDQAGNLYIADAGNNRIREVSHGIITTAVGGCATCVMTPNDDGEPAVGAHISSPRDVAIDGRGRLLIADSGNSRIRRVEDGKVYTVAGNGVPTLNSGYSGAPAPSYGDGGPATSASLASPVGGVAVDPDDQSILIADSGSDRIRRVDAQTGTITTVAGNGTFGSSCGDGGSATSACVDYPLHLAVAHHRVYIGEYDIGSSVQSDVNRVRVVTLAAVGHTTAAPRDAMTSGDHQRALAAMMAVWARLRAGLLVP